MSALEPSKELSHGRAFQPASWLGGTSRFRPFLGLAPGSVLAGRPAGWVFWVEAAPLRCRPLPGSPASGVEAWSRETPAGGIPVLFPTAVVPSAPAYQTASPTLATSPDGSGAVGSTRRSRRDVGADAPAEAPSSTMILPVVGALPGYLAHPPGRRPATPPVEPPRPAAAPRQQLRPPRRQRATGAARDLLGRRGAREERTYLRWLLPVGVGVGGVALG
ncbi:hypothetical protein NKG05_11475 [Oerskovia sp. M15]